MQGYDIWQNSATFPLVFMMISTTDHITGATGLFPTVSISKNGGAFATPSGSVSEMAKGWYKVAGNVTDSNTLGPLVLSATGVGTDPWDCLYPVVSFNPQNANFGMVAAITGSSPANWLGTTAVVPGVTISVTGGAPVNWLPPGATVSVTGVVPTVNLTNTTTNVTNAVGVSGIAPSSFLNNIDQTEPTGVALTFPQRVYSTWMKFFGKNSKDVTSHLIQTFAGTGLTVVTTQAYTDDGAGTETLGKAV